MAENFTGPMPCCCECQACKRDRLIEAAYKVGNPAQLKHLIADLRVELAIAETDLARANAVLDGEWPGAEEILTKGLEKAKAKGAESGG